MDVSSIVTGMSAPQQRGPTEKGSSAVSYDAFLGLLLTQLKNQDPTAPMESTDYMAQLASFSQVEQQTKTNGKLDALLTSSALSQADTVIGRTVTSADGKVTGEVASVKVYSDGLVATTVDGKEIILSPGITVK
ncbi:flagellar hook assembly protein FlgD [Bosea sp. 2KB_26]|uniref:flagellar hook assembly protein FlgD n=1 Tax=Bosea sp. 2KB_26 TaxID=3237475 RepID=UPI003F906EFB